MTATINKLLVALVMGIGDALAAGLVPQPWATVAVIVVSALGAAGVYVVPNMPAPPGHATP